MNSGDPALEWGILSQAVWKQAEGATTNTVTFQYPFTLAAATGDGCLGIPSQRRNSVYCSFTHSGAQYEYLRYKLERINLELGTRGRASSIRVRVDARTGSEYETCQAMVVSPALKELRNLLYPGGQKYMSSAVLELIGLEGLAVLWMDDGCVVRGERARNRGFLSKYVSKEEAERLCEWIGDLTAVRAMPNRDGAKWRVRIEMGHMPRFVNAIRPFVHSSMAHKVTLEYRNRTKSRAEYEASLTVPFVDEGDKVTRARSTSPVAA